MLELFSQCLRVCVDYFERIELALCGLTARITYEAGATTDDDERLMSAALEMHQPHYRNEIADVHTRRRRIETAIRGDRSLRQRRGQFLCVLMYQPAPFELVEHGRLSSHAAR